MSGENLARRRLLLLAPLALASAAGAGFLVVLDRMKRGAYDPHTLANPLLGAPVPDFSLPAQPPATTGFDSAALRAAGGPVLVNFFASWCVPCEMEHPQLIALQRGGAQIWGIAYKDSSAAAAGLLSRNGNPYARLARDEPGRVAIDWGVYGVPETFLVDRTGIIRWHQAGPIMPETITETLQPLLRRYA